MSSCRRSSSTPGRPPSNGSWSSSRERIANARTRAAYGRAVGQFLAWCEARRLGLESVSPAPRRGLHPDAPGIGPDRQAAPGRDPHALRLARRQPGPPREPCRGRARPEARRHQGPFQSRNEPEAEAREPRLTGDRISGSKQGSWRGAVKSAHADGHYVPWRRRWVVGARSSHAHVPRRGPGGLAGHSVFEPEEGWRASC